MKMNEEIMNAMGFGEAVDDFKHGKCTICRRPIKRNDFRDELSKRIYGISGMCQQCQDEIFEPDLGRYPQEGEE